MRGYPRGVRGADGLTPRPARHNARSPDIKWWWITRLGKAGPGEGGSVIDDHRHVIQMTLDQEIHVEAVREGDTIEDATVATEVTSFDRVGDAYVMEGGVLFAGYLRHPGAADGDVEHFHCRLPFVLRVPARAQSRGVLNVASRLPSWQLAASGDGWLHVKAVLQVTGLNGADGYHFECGAQQAGDLWFEDSAPGESASAPAAEDLVLTRGAGAESPPDAGANLREAVERLSEARSGHGQDTSLETLDRLLDGQNAVADPTAPASGAGANGEQDAVDARQDAAEAASAQGSAEAQATGGTGEASGEADGARMEGTAVVEDAPADPEASAPASGSVAEFEFSYQTDAASGSAPGPGDGAFVASRTFTESGFHATAGFVPEVRVQAASEDGVAARTDATAADGEPQDVRRPAERLWSFVDFHAPEAAYTLRFVVVMEEETLETVAERVGCSKTELLRVNRLTSDVLRPGQTLLVPETRVLTRT